jgi:hypothetical protein
VKVRIVIDELGKVIDAAKRLRARRRWREAAVDAAFNVALYSNTFDGPARQSGWRDYI